MTIDELLYEADPIAGIEVPLPRSSDARALMTTESPQYSLRIGQRRSRTPIVVSAFALALIATLVAVLTPVLVGGGPAPKTTAPLVGSGGGTGWQMAGYLSAPGWQSSSTLGPLPTTEQDALDLVCPTTQTCYSTGVGTGQGPNDDNAPGVISVTHDSAQQWTQTLSVPGMYFLGITCPTDEYCLATGTTQADGLLSNQAEPMTGYVTTDGGSTWSTVALPPAFSGGGVTLTCSTPSDCVEVTFPMPASDQRAHSYVTADGGEHWTTATFPADFFPSQISCSADGHCIAIGTDSVGPHNSDIFSAAYSTDAGSTWTLSNVPGGISSGFVKLSCPTAQVCDALSVDDDAQGYLSDATVLSSTNGGATWSSTQASGLNAGSAKEPANFDAFACASSGDCFATATVYSSSCEGSCPFAPVSAAMFASTDSGRTWNEQALPAPPSSTLQYGSVYPLGCVQGSETCYGVGILGLTAVAHAAGDAPVQQDVVISNTTDG